MWHSEGAPLQGLTFAPIADFSLYDDGQAIFTLPGVPWTQSLRHARLSQDQLQALLADAYGPGGLSTTRETYDDVPVEAYHTFFFNDGKHGFRQIIVQGLGSDDSEAPSAADRAKFKWLADRLADFDREVLAGKAQGLGEYQPTGYQVTLWPADDGLEVNAQWPWPELEMFPIIPMAIVPIRVVTPEQGQRVIDLGVDQNLVVVAPDGKPYQISIKPMLPLDYRIIS